MTSFDDAALAALPVAPGATAAVRERAYAEFGTLPMPSPETEEWRYTDLSGFALDFRPHTPGHGEGAPAPVGDLAATMLQHNSSVVMTTSGQDLDARGVIFCDLDVAAENAALGHEATVSKVGEDQLFYLMSRGLSEAEATAMIVNGFIEPITRELPMEYAVELNRLIELQMEGSVG